ncbi:hypothetical protein K4L44_04930 [Halosquirtibacter laminarini]|uniref:Uncharacterized protein n=1 Tax=Halosquirtibacter laminarini TaxID=3374600 RepID=A0AC61NKJ6_9BACT|nr:hypothetical protein K4L44_04930 [Prolixibacteraceae bacterium]
MSAFIEVEEIAICKKIHLNLYVEELSEEDEELSFVSQILLGFSRELPIDDPDKICVVDVNEKKILMEVSDISELSLSHYHCESLDIIDMDLDCIDLDRMPQGFSALLLESGFFNQQIMSRCPEVSMLYDRIQDSALMARYLENLEDGQHLNRSMLASLTEYEKLTFDTGITSFLRRLQPMTNLKELNVSKYAFSDEDVVLLGQLDSLESLSLSYPIRIHFDTLPKNLKVLSLSGYFANSILDLHLDSLSLENLYFDTCYLESIEGLSSLETLESLLIEETYVPSLDLTSLPTNLINLLYRSCGTEEMIIPEKDMKREVPHMERLDMCNNKITFDHKTLYNLTNYYPMLEVLSLYGNCMDSLPDPLFGESEEENCLGLVQGYFDLCYYEQEKQFEEVSETLSCAEQTERLMVCWDLKDAPWESIIYDIQYTFHDFWARLDGVVLFKEGIACKLPHYKMTIKIYCQDDGKLYYDVSAEDGPYTSVIFFNYLNELHALFQFQMNQWILPSYQFTERYSELPARIDRIIGLRRYVKKDMVLCNNQGVAHLLVNNVKRSYTKLSEGLDQEEYSSERLGRRVLKDKYYDASQVAFILFNGKNGYPFLVQEDREVSNSYDGGYFSLVLRTAEEKENYIFSLCNKFLNGGRFEKFVTKEKGLQVYYNPMVLSLEDESLYFRRKFSLGEVHSLKTSSANKWLHITSKEGELLLDYKAKA